MIRNRASDQRKSRRGTVKGRKRRRMWPTLLTLEDRLAPATFTDVAPTLTAALAAHETVTITALASTETLTLSSGDTWSGTDDANVTGNGSSTLTVTAAGETADTTILVTDSGTSAGDAVTFAGSGGNAYADNIRVALTNAAAGAITFNGASSFTGTAALTASTTGDVTIASAATLTQAAGTLSLTAGGNLTAPVDNGTAQITAPTITLVGAAIGASATDRVEVKATTLNALTAGGNIFINDTASGATTLNASTAGGNIFITTACGVTLGPDGGVNAGTGKVVLTAAGSLTDPGVFNGAVDFTPSSSGDTIERTDGLDWADFGFQIGQSIVVSGSEASGNNAAYTIQGVSGDTLTLTAENIVTAETGDPNVTVAVTDGVFNGPVAFAQNAGGATITTLNTTLPGIDPGPSWPASFQPGQSITVSGSKEAGNNTSYTIKTVSGDTLTLIPADIVTPENYLSYDIVTVALNDVAVAGSTVTLQTTGDNSVIGPIEAAIGELTATTDNGDVDIDNYIPLELGAVNAGNAMIQLNVAGAITDGTNGLAGNVNLTASGGAVLATTGTNSAIGTDTDPITTAIGALDATTNDGGVYISDSNPNVLFIDSVLAEQRGLSPSLNSNNQVVLVSSTASNVVASDDVSITATGPILLNSVTAPNMVTITSTGNAILSSATQSGSNNVVAQSMDLVAGGTADYQGAVTFTPSASGDTLTNTSGWTGFQAHQEIVVDGASSKADNSAFIIENISGDTLTLNTDNVVQQETDDSVTVGNGMIGLAGGAIASQVNNFSASTTNGAIFLSQDSDSTATSVTAGGNNNVSVTSSAASLTIQNITASGGSVTVTASSGSLIASSTSGIITGQNVSLSSQSGIGTSAAPFDTDAVADLSATVTSAGAPIYIDNSDAGTLGAIDATTQDGAVTIKYDSNNDSLSFQNGELTETGSAVAIFDNKGGNVVLGNVSAVGSVTASGAITMEASTAVISGNGRSSPGAVDFARNSNGDTITNTKGWAGFLPGLQISVSGASSTVNNMTYTIQGVSGDTLTLTATNTVTAEADSSVTVALPVALTASTGIGTSGTPIETDVSVLLNATTQSGGVYIQQDGAVTVSASTKDTTAAGDITLTDTSGDLTLGVISAPAGTVSLNADGENNILNGNNPSSEINVSASTLTLTASQGIGSSSAPLEASVDNLSADATLDDLWLVNNKALTIVSPGAVAGGNVSIMASGALTLNGVVTAGTSDNVTLTATGALTGDGTSDGEITASIATLAASLIGSSADPIQTYATTIDATATDGGIYLDNSNNTATLILTASANGPTNDIIVSSAGNIGVNTISAPGGTVTLSTGSNDKVTNNNTNGGVVNGQVTFAQNANGDSLTNTQGWAGFQAGQQISVSGAVTSGNNTTYTIQTVSVDTLTLTVKNTVTAEMDPNVTVTEFNIVAQILNITATGGVGINGTPVQVDAQTENVNGGMHGAFLTNTTATNMEVTAAELEAGPMGGGTVLTFSYPSITIAAINGTVSLPAGDSLILESSSGPIVFLNSADTIETSGGGTITVEAGTTKGSTAAVVLGNLKTAGGNITVSAPGNISIGQLNAGTGNVTVQSTAGIILSSNGASPAVIAGSATLSGNAPTASAAQLNEIQAIAAAAAASGQAAQVQTLANVFNNGLTSIQSAVANDNTAVTKDNNNLSSSSPAEMAVANDGKEVTYWTNVVNGTNTAAAALAIVASALSLEGNILLPIPLIGPGTAAGWGIASAVVGIAEGVLWTASGAASFTEFSWENQSSTDEGTVAADQSQYDRDDAQLGADTDTQTALQASVNAANAAAQSATLTGAVDQALSAQAIAAYNQLNVIGSAAAPLPVEVSGVLNVTAGPTDSYLQVTGPTTVNQIQTTGSVTLVSTGAVTAASGVTNVSATGLNVTAAGGIGTVAPLTTNVGTLTASNTTSGDIVISNTAPTPAGLNITGISNTAGNVSITEGSPMTVSGNITSAGAISLAAEPETLPATGDDLTVDPGVTIQSTGSSVSLLAGDNVFVPSGATIEADTTISITANANDDSAGESVTVAGTLIGTSASIGVDGSALGNETFNITPSVTTPITVDGGSDTDGGNTLNFNAGGLAVTISGDTITAAGQKAVTFTNIQFVNIINAAGGGSITLTASGTGDALNLLGTGQGAGTFTLNGGVPISFTGTNTFTFDSTGTNDTATITPFATPLLPWNVAVTVAGGTGTNGIIYNGVSAVSENITIQPSAYQAGQVIDTNAATGASIAVINYTNNSNITVNGSSTAGTAGDTDELTVAAPAGRATVSEANRIVTVTAPTSLGTLALEQVTLAADVQEVNLMGGSGPDTFQITPAAGIQYTSDGNLVNLVVNVVGATDAANDAMVIQSAGGGPLTNPNEFAVINRGSTPNSGYVSINTAGVEWPPSTTSTSRPSRSTLPATR
jgi:hypothetical protein